MRKIIRFDRPAVKNCGSRKGKGGCTWGGATKLITKIKIAA